MSWNTCIDDLLSTTGKIADLVADLHENTNMVQPNSPYKRTLELEWTPNPITGSGAIFLWGARQTGKTTYLQARFPDARYYDLLDTTLSAELSVQPGILRQEVLAAAPPSASSPNRPGHGTYGSSIWNGISGHVSRSIRQMIRTWSGARTAAAFTSSPTGMVKMHSTKRK